MLLTRKKEIRGCFSHLTLHNLGSFFLLYQQDQRLFIWKESQIFLELRKECKTQIQGEVFSLFYLRNPVNGTEKRGNSQAFQHLTHNRREKNRWDAVNQGPQVCCGRDLFCEWIPLIGSLITELCFVELRHTCTCMKLTQTTLLLIPLSLPKAQSVV